MYPSLYTSQHPEPWCAEPLTAWHAWHVNSMPQQCTVGALYQPLPASHILCCTQFCTALRFQSKLRPPTCCLVACVRAHWPSGMVSWADVLLSSRGSGLQEPSYTIARPGDVGLNSCAMLCCTALRCTAIHLVGGILSSRCKSDAGMLHETARTRRAQMQQKKDITIGQVKTHHLCITADIMSQLCSQWHENLGQPEALQHRPLNNSNLHNASSKQNATNSTYDSNRLWNSTLLANDRLTNRAAKTSIEISGHVGKNGAGKKVTRPNTKSCRDSQPWVNCICIAVFCATRQAHPSSIQVSHHTLQAAWAPILLHHNVLI